GPRKNGGRELRGCIGYIWPLKPLYQAVIDNAVTACTADYRFYSVKPEELDHIRIEISVLTPPRRINSYNDIVLGRDGIVLFKDGHQSVFLPFVATQFGWDLPTTLSELSRKAGLNPDDWRDGAKFDVFQADVFEERP
ncbi:MAG TPA: AmmeMemoRadiSam system protein A, partial [Candidatus Obscuribacterales bacterium]